jgi:hypothetical protein
MTFFALHVVTAFSLLFVPEHGSDSVVAATAAEVTQCRGRNFYRAFWDSPHFYSSMSKLWLAWSVMFAWIRIYYFLVGIEFINRSVLSMFLVIQRKSLTVVALILTVLFAFASFVLVLMKNPDVSCPEDGNPLSQVAFALWSCWALFTNAIGFEGNMSFQIEKDDIHESLRVVYDFILSLFYSIVVLLMLNLVIASVGDSYNAAIVEMESLILMEKYNIMIAMQSSMDSDERLEFRRKFLDGVNLDPLAIEYEEKDDAWGTTPADNRYDMTRISIDLCRHVISRCNFWWLDSLSSRPMGPPPLQFPVIAHPGNAGPARSHLSLDSPPNVIALNRGEGASTSSNTSFSGGALVSLPSFPCGDNHHVVPMVSFSSSPRSPIGLSASVRYGRWCYEYITASLSPLLRWTCCVCHFLCFIIVVEVKVFLLRKVRLK